MSVTDVHAVDVGGRERTTPGNGRRPADSVKAQAAVPVLAPEPLTLGGLLDQTAPLLEAPAFFGPPIVFVLGPWLLLVLLLIGPFALICTALLVLAAAIGALALLMALLVSPYLLIRHLHATARSTPSRAQVRLQFRYPGQL